MTITNNSTVGEIVRINFHAAQIFENNHIDFCCGGNQTVHDACQESGVDESGLLLKLNALLENEDWDSRYIENLPPDQLCKYIVERHHHYVSEKAPFLQQKLQKLCDVHGENHPELRSVKALFDKAVEKLTMHMQKEELLLFPTIDKLVDLANHETKRTLPAKSLADLITEMDDEHQTEGDRFKKIAEITGNYEVPPEGCTTFEVTYKTLKEFEKDLHRHIHLENNILFPKSLELERKLNLNPR